MPRWLLVVLAASPACLNPWGPPDPLTDGSTGASTGDDTGPDSSTGPADASSTSGGGSGSDSSDSTGPSGSTGTTGDDTTGDGTTTAASTSSSTGPAPFCGDGTVDPGEECDDADQDPADECNLVCARQRIVFVSDEPLTPKFIGGLALADAICRQYAQAAGHAHWTTFTAWLSDSKTSAAARLYPGKGRYVRPDGVLVAHDAQQFSSGQLEAPINVNEYGIMLEGAGVWTGTLPDGTAVPGAEHCNDWTSQSLQVYGHYGSATSTSSLWTYIPDPEVSPHPCILSYHLYCIEGK